MPSFALMLITDEGPNLAGRVARALANVPPGRVAVQLRMKAVGAGELLEHARELRAVTLALGAPLLINDRVDVALAVGADGVQLPERGLPPDAARALLGVSRLIGASCHDLPGLTRAWRLGADYVTLAPVHSVPGKGSPLGVSGVASLCQQVPVPVYALGGIDVGDMASLRAAGAHGAAVIRSVMGAVDPGKQARALLAAWDAAAPV